MISADIQTFKPHPLLRNAHLQTIAGRYLAGPTPPKKVILHKVQCPDGDMLALLENRANRKAPFKKVAVLMHGLAGDAESPYMLRMAARYLTRGWTVFRMNHRGCGAGAGLAKNTYHSGKSDDVAFTLDQITKLYPSTPLVAVGFSLSGNALLKLLGEGKDEYPNNLKGAISVTPPVNLSLCAAELKRPSRRIYDYRFVRQLKEVTLARQKQFPDFPNFEFPANTTVWDFDEICTAPLHGYRSAEDYYQKCSAKQFLGNIVTPTVIIASDDDPFVPMASFRDAQENKNVKLHFTRGGGHMGFISAQPTPLRDLRWMDYAVLKYSEALLMA